VSVAAGSGSNAATAAMCAWFVWRAVCSLSSARAALQLRTSLAQADSHSSPVWRRHRRTAYARAATRAAAGVSADHQAGHDDLPIVGGVSWSAPV
jgi:hypothetical protein